MNSQQLLNALFPHYYVSFQFNFRFRTNIDFIKWLSRCREKVDNFSFGKFCSIDGSRNFSFPLFFPSTPIESRCDFSLRKHSILICANENKIVCEFIMRDSQTLTCKLSLRLSNHRTMERHFEDRS